MLVDTWNRPLSPECPALKDDNDIGIFATSLVLLMEEVNSFITMVMPYLNRILWTTLLTMADYPKIIMLLEEPWHVQSSSWTLPTLTRVDFQ